MQQLTLDLFDRPTQAPSLKPAQQGASRTLYISDKSPLSAPKHQSIDQVSAPACFAHPQANRLIRFDHAHVSYVFRRGKRRTIGFALDYDGLTVSAPSWVPLTEVEHAIRGKQRWIVNKLNELRQRHERTELARIEWDDGALLPYLGEPVQLRIDPRQRYGASGAVLQANDDVQAVPSPRLTLYLCLPHNATPKQLRETTLAWLMRQARRVFTARLDRWAPQLNVRWQRLGLSSANTRWGSASADGSIRLNWRLIHLREAIIDYVVVHELAHLREMNHGPKFWQHVGLALPDYGARRTELRKTTLPPL